MGRRGDDFAPRYAQHLVDALLTADGTEAESIVHDAGEAGLAPAEIYEVVIRPAMEVVGEMWQANLISPGEEHVATAIVERRLFPVLRRRHVAVEQRSGLKVLLAAVEGEQHVLALEMAAVLLEDAGFEVVFAGPDVPHGSLESLIRRHRADLVALSATMAMNTGSLRIAAGLARGRGYRPVIAGGAAAAAIVGEPAVVVLDRVAPVVETADRLLGVRIRA